MNKYTALYKSYTNIQLLEILDRVADYNPEAISAAQAEFKARALTAEEIATCQAMLESKKNKGLNLKKYLPKFDPVPLPLDAGDNSLLDKEMTQDYLDEKLGGQAAKYYFYILVLSVLWLVRDFYFLVKYWPKYWDVELVAIVAMPYALFCSGLFWFYKRDSRGWWILLSFSVYAAAYTLLNTFYLIYTLFTQAYPPNGFVRGVIINLIVGASLGVLVWFLLRASVKYLYRIERKASGVIIVLCGLVLILFLTNNFLYEIMDFFLKD